MIEVPLTIIEILKFAYFECRTANPTTTTQSVKLMRSCCVTIQLNTSAPKVYCLTNDKTVTTMYIFRADLLMASQADRWSTCNRYGDCQ